MQRIQLTDRPSQKYTMPIGDTRLDVMFSYNQMADRWAVTWWAEFETCPIRAGRLIEPGVNLLEGVSDSHVMLVLDRPGVSGAGVNWLNRLTAPLGDGKPMTWLVIAPKDEWRALLWPERAGLC
jgi:hypothetical protein